MTNSAPPPSAATRCTQPSPSAANRYDVFLSHRFKDKAEVDALQQHIENSLGYSVYVDWKVDRDLDRARADQDSAERFRLAMRHCRCLLFYARPEVDLSKWMPWELGFFDGRHGARRIAVYADDPESFRPGQQEYLDLYQVVGRDTLSGFLDLATEDTAAMTSATYDQLQRHAEKVWTDPLDYGLSLAQWWFGVSANLMLDPARMQALGDDEPSGPLLPWLEPFGACYQVLRQQQDQIARLRGEVRRQARVARVRGTGTAAREQRGQATVMSALGAQAATGAVRAQVAEHPSPFATDFVSLLAQTLQQMPWSLQRARPGFEAAVTKAR